MSFTHRKNIVALALAIGTAGAVGMPAGLIALAAPTTEPSASQTQGISISGTVHDGAGPAAGAHVYLLRHFGRRSTTQPSDTDQGDGSPRGAGRVAKILGASGAEKGKLHGRIVAQADADSNGNFTLQDVPPGRYVIVAHEKKEGEAHQPIVVGTSALPPIILELQRHHAPTTAPAT